MNAPVRLTSTPTTTDADAAPALQYRAERMRIAGQRVAGERTLDVCNPWNGVPIGSVPAGGVADVRRAFEGARAYRPTLTRHQRSKLLSGAARRLRVCAEEASALITLESGLCRKDSLHEIRRVCDVLELAAAAVLADDGQCFAGDLTQHGRQRRVFTTRDPLRGVIAAITPFNHPMNQVAHKVVPAIATNNRIVVKPSEKTPLSALYFADLLYQAGLPEPMLQVVTGDPAAIGDELVTNEHVEMVSFTGSVAAGKSIFARAGYRRVCLELGGNDPAIVMDDADLDEAATLVAQGSYRNSGQRCTAVKRILVHEAVADRFIAALVEKTRAWTYGDPMDPTIEMGTVIDERAARLIESRVDAAVERGAHVLCGHQRRGASYAPTVLDRVDPDAELVMQETFGPVSPIMRFASIDEAIALANRTRYGLSSAVFTNRLDHIARFVAELEVGSVNVREVPGWRLEVTPFGGIKDSGLGQKEGVHEAMKSFTTLKTFSLPAF